MESYPSIETVYLDDDSCYRERTLLSNGEIIKSFMHTELLNYYPLERNDLCVVIIGWDKSLDMVAKLIKKIQNNKINKIYFFIQDIFRLRDENSKRISHINPNYMNYAFELDVIDLFLRTLDHSSHEIYHCEVDKNNLFGKNLKYFDAYLTRLGYLRNLGSELKYKGQFEQRFCCFNGRFQAERYLLCCFLAHHDTFITNLYHASDDELVNDPRFYIDTINERYRNKILDGNKLLSKKIKKLDLKSPKFNIGMLKTSSALLSIHNNNKNTVKITKKSFCEIVTETNFSRHLPNISEKVIKTIMCKRPFILVAPPNTLRLLKNLGFETFSSVWDESYDEIENDKDRLEKIFQLIEEIGSWSDEKILEVNSDIKRILKHNRKHFETKKYLEVMRDLN